MEFKERRRFPLRKCHIEDPFIGKPRPAGSRVSEIAASRVSGFGEPRDRRPSGVLFTDSRRTRISHLGRAPLPFTKKPTMRAHPTGAAAQTDLPDALLVKRVAALSDRAALAELDARHGMTLYAIAYSLLFDSQAADTAVAAAFRELWRSAAALDASAGSVARWLADFTRRAVRD